MKVKYGYCPYCFRYIGSGYIYTEHKRLCKNVSDDVREINQGNVENNKSHSVFKDHYCGRIESVKSEVLLAMCYEYVDYRQRLLRLYFVR